MVHVLQLRLQGLHVLIAHAFDDDKRERALAKFLHQLVLAHHRVDVAGQVGEHVIIDARRRHAQQRGDHQQQCDDQDRDAAFDHSFCKTHGHSLLLE